MKVYCSFISAERFAECTTDGQVRGLLNLRLAKVKEGEQEEMPGFTERGRLYAIRKEARIAANEEREERIIIWDGFNWIPKSQEETK